MYSALEKFYCDTTEYVADNVQKDDQIEGLTILLCVN